MICDPFICIKGPKIGEIHWIETLGFTTDIGYHYHEQFAGCHFKRFADFEREHSYIHNGEARRAIIVRKARSSKLHQVIQYADGLFSDAAPYPSFA